MCMYPVAPHGVACKSATEIHLCTVLHFIDGLGLDGGAFFRGVSHLKLSYIGMLKMVYQLVYISV